ncbi:class I SAM-dependent methyltransferase [Chthonobacter rhizosphaerae]|uniref:class I SAM-dependent methyltransferase n=1 Tax=Chthonobacter rhizosphaerae TaxID=2735553 RepID=UPI0015EFB9A1|nr:class I SAM-dependent methyltransferase [Chthonobacter rhizosphaerae]
MDAFRAANRANWDDRAALHATDKTGMYGIAAVLAGRSCLHPVDRAGIGDVTGLRVAHLQCHIGLDTLSLAHLGASPVGLDFSPNAVAAARDFASRAGRPDVSFVEADVYAARQALSGDFDLVYVTWGAINWLPDIGRWAAVAASLLRPGGRLFLAETHPSALVLDEVDGRIEARFSWRTAADAPIATDDETSYTGDPRPIANTRNYEWIHPLSVILGGVLDAGLRLVRFQEHETLPYRLYPSMVPADRDEDGRVITYRLPDGAVRFPLSFSLTAEKPA